MYDNVALHQLYPDKHLFTEARRRPSIRRDIRDGAWAKVRTIHDPRFQFRREGTDWNILLMSRG
jgi:hypothetical protein